MHHHAVLQVHYDNPKMEEGIEFKLTICSIIMHCYIITCCPYAIYIGITDSSGMRLYYSSTPRKHDAGVMFLGHEVNKQMIIPPGAPKYTIGSICLANCTENVCYNNCCLSLLQ